MARRKKNLTAVQMSEQLTTSYERLMHTFNVQYQDRSVAEKDDIVLVCNRLLSSLQLHKRIRLNDNNRFEVVVLRAATQPSGQPSGQEAVQPRFQPHRDRSISRALNRPVNLLIGPQPNQPGNRPNNLAQLDNPPLHDNEGQVENQPSPPPDNEGLVKNQHLPPPDKGQPSGQQAVQPRFQPPRDRSTSRALNMPVNLPIGPLPNQPGNGLSNQPPLTISPRFDNEGTVENQPATPPDTEGPVENEPAPLPINEGRVDNQPPSPLDNEGSVDNQPPSDNESPVDSETDNETEILLNNETVRPLDNETGRALDNLLGALPVSKAGSSQPNQPAGRLKPLKRKKTTAGDIAHGHKRHKRSIIETQPDIIRSSQQLIFDDIGHTAVRTAISHVFLSEFPLVDRTLSAVGLENQVENILTRNYGLHMEDVRNVFPINAGHMDSCNMSQNEKAIQFQFLSSEEGFVMECTRDRFIRNAMIALRDFKAQQCC